MVHEVEKECELVDRAYHWCALGLAALDYSLSLLRRFVYHSVCIRTVHTALKKQTEPVCIDKTGNPLSWYPIQAFLQRRTKREEKKEASLVRAVSTHASLAQYAKLSGDSRGGTLQRPDATSAGKLGKKISRTSGQSEHSPSWQATPTQYRAAGQS